ncbi:aminotransferase class V-fold PLP-dependent enzyme [Oribacterium sinus]
MKEIYLDQGATSYPKAPGVGMAMANYIDNIGASINRGSYGKAMEVGNLAIRLRERACKLFAFQNPGHVIITPGASIGLNMLIMPLFQEGGHVIISPLEHNAVRRPLEILLQRKEHPISLSTFPYDLGLDGDFSPLENLIRPNTKAVIMLHASNVSGEIFPVEAIGKICKEKGIDFILDASQSGGHIPIDFEKMNLSALVLPGHKGLLGPQGIGLTLLREGFAKKLPPYLFGGTGSVSESLTMPGFMPDKFEPGTPNIPGIYGLEKALQFIEETGVEVIEAYTKQLHQRFLEGLYEIKGKNLIRIPGKEGRENSGVVSIDFCTMDNALVCNRLANRYGIMTRQGLHCAPIAHQCFGTEKSGTVRFSFGFFNRMEEIDRTLLAIQEILS